MNWSEADKKRWNDDRIWKRFTKRPDGTTCVCHFVDFDDFDRFFGGFGGGGDFDRRFFGFFGGGGVDGHVCLCDGH
ncbi:unnamed protein product [Rotaria sp. Silwood1]|nr:unnamed protein product [Rotaria sp. Silwood1]CAF1688792.1 unnamed protein product [Rotaria sp. Silwood1]